MNCTKCDGYLRYPQHVNEENLWIRALITKAAQGFEQADRLVGMSLKEAADEYELSVTTVHLVAGLIRGDFRVLLCTSCGDYSFELTEQVES